MLTNSGGDFTFLSAFRTKQTRFFIIFHYHSVYFFPFTLSQFTLWRFSLCRNFTPETLSPVWVKARKPVRLEADEWGAIVVGYEVRGNERQEHVGLFESWYEALLILWDEKSLEGFEQRYGSQECDLIYILNGFVWLQLKNRLSFIPRIETGKQYCW